MFLSGLYDGTFSDTPHFIILSMYIKFAVDIAILTKSLRTDRRMVGSTVDLPFYRGEIDAYEDISTLGREG